ncbi:preprotein translocase subunit SecE [Leucobacter sp. 1207-22]|uniref:preprotein translocase subunit SecE n=1 Tax=Leucobacter sp. 1207-22 TaxID=2604456 RepID=UPI004062EEDA
MSSTEVEGVGSADSHAHSSDAKKRGFFGRIILFIQQVFSELKKVVTPTRKELVNFTLVVIGFVVVMMGLVWVLDQLFGWLAVFVFGSLPA